jgi:hypothetical protein
LQREGVVRGKSTIATLDQSDLDRGRRGLD